MQDYTSKSAFGKDVLPHNTEASFSQLHNSPAKFTVLQNGGSSDAGKIQKATKSDATPAKSGSAVDSFFGGK